MADETWIIEVNYINGRRNLFGQSTDRKLENLLGREGFVRNGNSWHRVTDGANARLINVLCLNTFRKLNKIERLKE